MSNMNQPLADLLWNGLFTRTIVWITDIEIGLVIIYESDRNYQQLVALLSVCKDHVVFQRATQSDSKHASALALE